MLGLFRRNKREQKELLYMNIGKAFVVRFKEDIPFRQRMLKTNFGKQVIALLMDAKDKGVIK